MTNMEIIKRDLHKYSTKDGILIINPHESCIFSDICPFIENGTTYCQGINEDRSCYFYCNILELLRIWDNA